MSPPPPAASADLPALCLRIGHDPDALEALYRASVRDVERFVARRVRDPYDVAASHHLSTAREQEVARRVDARSLVDEDAYERLVEQVDAAARARTLRAQLADLPRVGARHHGVCQVDDDVGAAGARRGPR